VGDVGTEGVYRLEDILTHELAHDYEALEAPAHYLNGDTEQYATNQVNSVRSAEGLPPLPNPYITARTLLNPEDDKARLVDSVHGWGVAVGMASSDVLRIIGPQDGNDQVHTEHGMIWRYLRAHATLPWTWFSSEKPLTWALSRFDIRQGGAVVLHANDDAANRP